MVDECKCIGVIRTVGIQSRRIGHLSDSCDVAYTLIPLCMHLVRLPRSDALTAQVATVFVSCWIWPLLDLPVPFQLAPETASLLTEWACFLFREGQFRVGNRSDFGLVVRYILNSLYQQTKPWPERGSDKNK